MDEVDTPDGNVDNSSEDDVQSNGLDSASAVRENGVQDENGGIDSTDARRKSNVGDEDGGIDSTNARRDRNVGSATEAPKTGDTSNTAAAAAVALLAGMVFILSTKKSKKTA